MLLESAPLFLLGLLLAGLLSVFLNAKTVTRLVGGSRFISTFKAALIGVPLPLCSCSVLPVAKQLHDAGMKRGPLTAFLISTPESGVDSIFLTWSLTDPLLTVARPVSAFLSAMAAGFIQTNDEAAFIETKEEADDCCSSCCTTDEATKEKTIFERLIGGVRYAFTDLIADLAPFLLFGFVLAGLLDALFGSYLSNLAPFWKSGPAGYIGAIISGLPLYICATSSTPLAAVLMINGFSPGAVLVFLLVGPATNVASLVVLKKLLGLGGTVRYLVAIIVTAVLCGILTDYLYGVTGLEAIYRLSSESDIHSLFSYGAAIFLSLLILYWTFLKAKARLF